jgi:hypothetical protein
MGKYKVTGLAPVIGNDGEPVPPGGTVELDEHEIAPGKTNIDALVESGCIEAPKVKAKQDDTKPADAEPAKAEPKPKDG